MQIEISVEEDSVAAKLRDAIIDWISENTRQDDALAVLVGLGLAAGYMGSIIDDTCAAPYKAALSVIGAMADQAYDEERLESAEPAGHA